MKSKILIIDDNEKFLETTRDILLGYGYNVVTLSDPRKTEQCINDERPDLLIMDIKMPGRSGFNIIEDFNERKIYENIPKLFLTVIDDSTEKLVAHARGVKDYITKPFDPPELVNKIKKCLEENCKNKKNVIR